MNAATQSLVEDTAAASHAERITFPDVVHRLAEAGIERYQADLARSETTYYAPDGSSHVVPWPEPAPPPAIAFGASAVEAAIRASQAQRIKYREFCREIAAAGCVGYIVSLSGRRAVYFGRSGESHVEPFPLAP